MSMMSLASPQIGYSAHLTHCTSIHWFTVNIMAAGLRSLWHTCTQTSPVNSGLQRGHTTAWQLDTPGQGNLGGCRAHQQLSLSN